MTYELAKQLKDAGFPQDGREGQLGSPSASGIIFWNRSTPPESHAVYFPILSELIRACGEKFLSLEFIIDGGMDGNERLWWAVSRRSLVPEEYQIGGETPEEAVANLWLELNK